MADESDVPVASEGSAGKWILLALAVIYVAGSLYFIFDLRGRLDKMSKDQATSSTQIADLGKRMQSAEADDETLATQLGMTKKEMVSRSAELVRQQKASEARLAEQQKQQISAVSGEVEGVKTDVGGVKTDVASTKADLESTGGVALPEADAAVAAARKRETRRVVPRTPRTRLGGARHPSRFATLGRRQRGGRDGPGRRRSVPRDLVAIPARQRAAEQRPTR